MDKQLMEVFNNRYFSKNQLRKRIYDENELEILWKKTSYERKQSSTDVGIELKGEKSSWYNITDDVQKMIEYIYDIQRSEIIEYLEDYSIICSGNINNIKEPVQSNKRFLDINDIEEFYRDTYIDNLNTSIYRCDNKIEELEVCNYKLKSDNCMKELLCGVLNFIEKDKLSSSIIKAGILHFYISYLKPFDKYNLQMTEYITNRYLINNGYEIMSYCKSLTLIKADERKYYKAMENSIVNDGDITYFIKYYVGIIQSSIKELTKEVSVKCGKKIMKELMKKNNVLLEDRQIKFVNSMVVLSNNKISIDDYKRKSKVSYETARSDLNVLVGFGFFKISKLGKKYEYYFNDISTIIDNFN